MSILVGRNIRTTLEMIRSSTRCSPSFAFLGAVLAAQGLPTLWQGVWIAWRWSARARRRWPSTHRGSHFRRTESAHKNARDSRRLLSLPFVWGLRLSPPRFFLASAMLNQLTLLLAPVALGSVRLYSYTKRFTSLSHIVLGWCLSIAPTGAWIAVRGALDSSVPLLLSLVVLCGRRGSTCCTPVRIMN